MDPLIKVRPFYPRTSDILSSENQDVQNVYDAFLQQAQFKTDFKLDLQNSSESIHYHPPESGAYLLYPGISDNVAPY